MFKGRALKYILSLFLLIFIGKLSIAIAPLVKQPIDSESINRVIMQLEQEHPDLSVDLTATVLDLDAAALNHVNQRICYIFQPHASTRFYSLREDFTLFYPMVPTPPPNIHHNSPRS